MSNQTRDNLPLLLLGEGEPNVGPHNPHTILPKCLACISLLLSIAQIIICLYLTGPIKQVTNSRYWAEGKQMEALIIFTQFSLGK